MLPDGAIRPSLCGAGDQHPALACGWTQRWSGERSASPRSPCRSSSASISPTTACCSTTWRFCDGGDDGRQRVDPAQGRGGDRLRLGRDLDHEQLTIADCMRAIEFALAGHRDRRLAHPDWDIGILDTIADNASSGLYVLAPRPSRLDGFELRLCGMVMEKGGEPVSVGAGAACLGSPLSRGAVARQDDGARRTASQGGRHGAVRRARADGGGQAGAMCTRRGFLASAPSAPRSAKEEA